MIKIQESIYDSYKDKLSKEDFNKLASVDSTEKKKYTRWIVDSWLKAKKNYPEAQLPEDRKIVRIPSQIICTWVGLKNLLSRYDIFSQNNLLLNSNNSIFSFKNYDSFLIFMDEHQYDIEHKLELKKIEKEAKKNSIIIYKTDKYIWVEPKSHEAARKWGTHTKWCVSTSNIDYWMDHSTIGRLFIKRSLTPTGAIDTTDWAFALYIPLQEPSSGSYVPNKPTVFDKADDKMRDAFNFLDGLDHKTRAFFEQLIDEHGGINEDEEEEGYARLDGDIFYNRNDKTMEFTIGVDELIDDEHEVIDSKSFFYQVSYIGKDFPHVFFDNSDAAIKLLEQFDYRKGRGIVVTLKKPKSSIQDSNDLKEYILQHNYVDEDYFEWEKRITVHHDEFVDYVIWNCPTDTDTAIFLEEFFGTSYIPSSPSVSNNNLPFKVFVSVSVDDETFNPQAQRTLPESVLSILPRKY